MEELLPKPEMVLCAKIHPSPANKRVGRHVNIDELSDSIRNQGLLQAPIVRPHPQITGEYEMVCGERRWRACSILGESMPVIIRNLSDSDAHEITVTENFQRENLSPMEEAEAVTILASDGKSYEEIADRLGKPLTWVARRAKLVNLSAKILKVLENPESGVYHWSASHLELVARFDQHIQDSFIDQYVQGYYSDVPISLSELKAELDEYLLKLSAAPWKLSDATLVPDVGACETCQKRTSCQTSLFDQIEERGKIVDQCIDRECWSSKMRVFVNKKHTSLAANNPSLVKISTSYRPQFIPEGDPLLEGAIASHRYHEVKKNTPGAMQALVVDGPGAGSVKYVAVFEQTGAAGKSGATKTLRERREALERRRHIKVIDKVLGLIISEIAEPKLILKKSEESVLVAALTFGVDSLSTVNENECVWDSTPWERFEKQETRNLSFAGLITEIMRCVLPKFKNLLVADKNMGVIRLDNASKICDFLGVAVGEIIDTVKTEIKEPKSWEQLNEDGTPKDPTVPSEPEKIEKKVKGKPKKASGKKNRSLRDVVPDDPE